MSKPQARGGSAAQKRCADALVRISRRLASAVDELHFDAPITHVYSPLVYARAAHEQYLTTWGWPPKEVLLLGMNPGPFGMAQTGVPFGEVSAVQGFLGLEAAVGKPATEHPKRPVEGFACTRSEVSGRRLWGWAQDRFEGPGRFFERFFVHNYCPLVFMVTTGANFTPDKLPKLEREALFAACDVALADTVAALRPRWVLGVGKFAEKRAKAVLGHLPVEIGSILHPSPASPAANRGWSEAIETQLHDYGIVL